MKIERLETHDRLKHLIQDQSVNIFKGAEDCLKVNELSLAIQERSPYVYLFAHPRTADDGVTKVMYWQPRLSIPEPQTNSYLFRAQSKTDIIEVVWMIPPRETWDQYKKGNITEDNLALWSINQFQYHRRKMSQPHPQDLPEEQARSILQQVINEKRQQIRMDLMWTKND